MGKKSQTKSPERGEQLLGPADPRPALPGPPSSSAATACSPLRVSCCWGLGSVCLRPGWSFSGVPRPSAALAATRLLPEILGARAARSPCSSEPPQPSGRAGWKQTAAQPGPRRRPGPCSHSLGQLGLQVMGCCLTLWPPNLCRAGQAPGCPGHTLPEAERGRDRREGRGSSSRCPWARQSHGSGSGLDQGC